LREFMAFNSEEVPTGMVHFLQTIDARPKSHAVDATVGCESTMGGAHVF
jgi:hypothetical protein